MQRNLEHQQAAVISLPYPLRIDSLLAPLLVPTGPSATMHQVGVYIYKYINSPECWEDYERQ